MLHINYTRQKLSPLARRQKVLDNLEACVSEKFITEAQAARLYDAAIELMEEDWSKDDKEGD